MTTTKRADRLALGDVIAPDKHVVAVALDPNETHVAINYRDPYTPPDLSKRYWVTSDAEFQVVTEPVDDCVTVQDVPNEEDIAAQAAAHDVWAKWLTDTGFVASYAFRGPRAALQAFLDDVYADGTEHLDDEITPVADAPDEYLHAHPHLREPQS